jgi:hypothetical protein
MLTSTRATPSLSAASQRISATVDFNVSPSAGDFTVSTGFSLSPSALKGARDSLLAGSASPAVRSGSTMTFKTTSPAGAAAVSSARAWPLAGMEAMAVRASSMSSPPALNARATVTCFATPEPRLRTGTRTVRGVPPLGWPSTRISAEETERSGASTTSPGVARTAAAASAAVFAAVYTRVPVRLVFKAKLLVTT